MADVSEDGLEDDVAVDYNLNGALVALQKLSLANKLYLPLVSKTAMS